MTIEFHEPEFELDESAEAILPKLDIIEPDESHGWLITFEAKDIEEASLVDESIDTVLHLQTMMPHLLKEHSTETHHEWEIGDPSMSRFTKEEVLEHLNDSIIPRIREKALRDLRSLKKAA